MRVGQKNKLTYRWARKGSRPRAIHDQRTQSTYLFGAVCPERGAGAALVLPACNTEAMQLHLDEIATKVTPGAHARSHSRSSWMARRQRPQGSQKHLAPAAAAACAGWYKIWQFELNTSICSAMELRIRARSNFSGSKRQGRKC